MSRLTIITNDTPNGTFSVLETDSYFAYVIGQGNAWEPFVNTVYSQLVNASDTVVNIGAHIGVHAIPLAKLAKEVHAIEMQEMMYWLLQRNVKQNRCDNVHLYHSAVGHVSNLEVTIANTAQDGDAKGTAVKYEDGTNMNFGGLSLGKGGERVPMVTLDSLKLSPQLMLIDVEGAERMVFWGAKETIKAHHPIIMYEQNAKYITREMKEACKVPDTVRFFDFEEWCMSIGYQPPVILGEERVLYPGVRECDVVGKYNNGQFEILEDGTIVLSGRGNALYRFLSDSRIHAYFMDHYEVCVGDVDDGTVRWSNGSEWIRDSQYDEEVSDFDITLID